MALYRKYRPASFSEVVGQEHVTDPLSVALSSGRINHAYLFSGPRGCGKTSSARILARSLNCVQGPTPDPCGECDSCIALAPGGSGTLDVTELDAASHGGVDDTRDLRERAFFAPASSRYRVLIIDEAHMVTNAGFNALLKIVEEPPEHLIFIFATTEPDKVLPTIRSRTHHYPFRLLTPSSMRGLLERICDQERVQVDPTVFPLVIRAGGGSPRDTLSVLDQLMAGAGDEGITYPRAVALLGATEVALIDDTVDALAVGDGATLFRTVDKVVEAGHDPRRFAADLLQRLRDLIMVQSVPQAIERGLVDAPVEQAETMRRQAENIGAATLARCADMVHEGLGSMRGATSPRLLLEILCAKLLLPSADDSVAALLQRIESLEAGRPAGGGGAAPVGARPAVGGGRRSDDDDTAAAGPGGASAPQTAGTAAPAEGRPKFVRRSQQQKQPAAEAAQPQAPAPVAPAVEPPTPAAATPESATPAPAMTESAVPEHATAVPQSSAHEPPAHELPEPVSEAARPVVAPNPAAPTVPGESVAGQQAARQSPNEQSHNGQPTTQGQPGPTPATDADHAPSEDVVVSPQNQCAPTSASAPTPAAAPAPSSAPAAEPTPAAAAAAPAPESAPAASSSGTVIEAEDIRRAWPAIRDAVRTRTRTVEVMLAGATVAGVDGQVIHLVHDYAPLAKRLTQPHNATAITDSITEVVGGQWEITCTSGSAPRGGAPGGGTPSGGAPAGRQPAGGGTTPAPAPAAQGPATQGSAAQGPAGVGPGGPATPASEAPATAQQPEPRGWERRVRDAGAAHGSGAGGYDDIPPPPEEPEPDEPEAPPITEDEMIDEARTSGPQNLDHRTGEDMALALLKEHLGARPIDR
ncbi:hypothetical protein NCCP2495_17120 [Dietzia sp. NCCP-2495]|uniref:DNA polymerase III subunit gamma and tau n=1 Tax=Dietzia sp. NCCP-2495 TaxID=2934675 RepID=UPI0022327EE3|nr:DNA polymerase III subunit gamma and tau [Dietzia sp. NCCP-2495]GLB63833.1 hypothetical protein NCCP2495_17120 [Dietzia sp. NCCP-2495]